MLPLLVLSAGCALAPPNPRFALGTPELRSPALRTSAAPARIVALLQVHRDRVAACFDELLARHALLDPKMSVTLELELRNRAVSLLAVRPAGPQTVVDRTLTACLDEVMIPWRAEEGSGGLMVPLQVSARTLAVEVAADSPRWRPAEKRGE